MVDCMRVELYLVYHILNGIKEEEDMKKVVGICIYSKHYEDGEPCYQVWNFTVNHNGNSIPLVTYNLDCGPEPYKYHTFNDLYGSLINILKNNGFYTQVSSEFGRDFYNISFIEYGKVGISKFGYEKEA